MRYRVAGARIIRTENAAKPLAQRSKFLHDYISALPPVESAFDLGCGKLRYLESISNSSSSVLVVDSEIQLSRFQKLGPFGYTNIREALGSSNNKSVENIADFRRGDRRFERGFCLNVLPIIPCPSNRMRVIRAAKNNLKAGGECIFVVHYNNKEYRKLPKMEGSSEFRDGVILDSLRGFSFFAIIKPDELQAMVKSGGFVPVEQKIVNGSVFLRAEVS